MDDLTVLREYRAGQPGPTPAETDAARTALIAAIEAEPVRRRPRPAGGGSGCRSPRPPRPG